jgi:hypothetical protein
MKLIGAVLMLISGSIMGLGLGVFLGIPLIAMLCGGLLGGGFGLFIIGARIVNDK